MRRTGAAILLASTALAPMVLAQPKKPTPDKGQAPGASGSAKAPPATSGSAAPTASSTKPSGGAIGAIATELSKGLGTVSPGAVVIVSPVASDLPMTKPDDLAIRIATQIAGKLGIRAHDKPLPLAAARGQSGRAASLVFVQLEIVKGELRATADLYPVVDNGWERVRNPAPAPRAHGFASAPMDAEIRAFLQPIVLEQAQLHKAKQEEGDVIALGCGDVDGDGGNELVMATRQKVSIGKLRGGKFVPTKSVKWAELANKAPVPMREPLASIVVSPRAHKGEILIGTTDRGSIALDGSLTLKRQLAGVPVVGSDGDACTTAYAEAGAFAGVIATCAPREKGQKVVEVLPAPALLYDTLAIFDAVGRDGSVVPVVAAREPSAKLRVKTPGNKDLIVENVGAQLAVMDLDLDGVPEIASTTENEQDILVVSSLVKNNLSAKLRYPAKDGVRALAACPPEEKGVPALAAVVGNEVWLVR